MEYISDFARVGCGRQRLRELNTAAGRLAYRLSALNPEKLDISEYNKRYFGRYMRAVDLVLQHNTQLLGLALKETQKPLADVVLVDYGGGSGIFSLLAKELGVGTVIYSDIYETSCLDAAVIGEAVAARADAYVTGELDAVIAYLESAEIGCDAICSYDVIEHIYDLDSFYARLADLPSGESLTIAMASGANIRNPRTRRQLTALHRRVEFEEQQPGRGHKDRDTLRSFLDLRRELITDHASKSGYALDDDDVAKLASATRGQDQSDIRATVDSYVQNPATLPTPATPTNTADPLTGNWAENLVEPGPYAKILRDRGFQVSILPGYYPRHHGTIKRLVCAALNEIISLAGPRALALAPYFVIFATKTAPPRARQAS
jgi:2-polyprenyl-3-methyl-5-hydroxy-6-metoxy-1,4-benzoquinol methylase